MRKTFILTGEEDKTLSSLRKDFNIDTYQAINEAKKKV